MSMSSQMSTRSAEPVQSVDAAASAAPATPLARALDQNEAAKEAVEQSASELLVINAVLKQELPARAQSGDVAQALQKTDALETKISVAAQDMAEVNEVLAQEIDQRAELEHELAQTQAALVKAIAKQA